MRKEFLLLGAGLVLILGSAFVHGVLTDRWEQSADLSVAAAKLETIPESVGDWYSQSLEISESQLRGAEAVGHLSRTYRNKKTQKEVQVLIHCGPRGPIAVHPPTVCFTSAGLKQTYAEEVNAIEASNLNGEFWRTTFTRQTPDGVSSELDTFWAWSVYGDCEAPTNPRIEYARSPYLYKIYVTHRRAVTIDGSAEQVADDPCEDFLKAFLPQFQAALSASAPPK